MLYFLIFIFFFHKEDSKDKAWLGEVIGYSSFVKVAFESRRNKIESEMTVERGGQAGESIIVCFGRSRGLLVVQERERTPCTVRSFYRQP